MKSFHDNPSIKEALIKRMDDHIAADELLQKATGQDGNGCTVWCALNNGDLKEGYNHAAFETILGLPEWLAELQDKIFEGLNKEDAKAFSAAWPKCIPVGVDLTPVKWKFCAFIMQQNIKRVLLLNISDELKKKVVDAINGVLKLHTDAVEAGKWDGSAARSAARSAAWSAAWSARSAARSARSAARSAESAAWSASSAAESAAWSASSVESAARSAARSAESAAESAAWSAARSARSAAESAAWSAARSARSAAGSAAWSAARSAYKRYADKLIELLTNQK